MKVKLKTAFSILDGRLSTDIGDVYEMLNYIYDDNLYTHQLPEAMRTLQETNPEWFRNAVSVVDELKHIEGTNDFNQLMKAIDMGYSNFEIELGKMDHHIPFSSGFVPKTETK